MGLHQRFFTGHLIHCRLIHWGESNGNMIYSRKPKKGYWLVVWSMFYFSIQLGMECHHPNWRTPSFFRGVGQPPTRLKHVNISFLHLAVVQNVAVLCPSSDRNNWDCILERRLHRCGVGPHYDLTGIMFFIHIYIYIYTHIFIYRESSPHGPTFQVCETWVFSNVYIYTDYAHTLYTYT